MQYYVTRGVCGAFPSRSPTARYRKLASPGNDSREATETPSGAGMLSEWFARGPERLTRGSIDTGWRPRDDPCVVASSTLLVDFKRIFFFYVSEAISTISFILAEAETRALPRI